MMYKVTLLFIAAAAASFALRRASAAVRHLVWMLALAASLMVPLASRVAPAISLPEGVRFVSDGVLLPAAAATSIPWLRWIWIAGSILVALRFAAGHVGAARIVRSARPGAIRDGYRVRAAAAGTMAFTWGLIRPVVVLPEGAPDAIWLHERAHASRGDHWWLLLAQLAGAVYWFHPLAWYAIRQAAHEREQACDDRALAAGADPVAYAELLVETARAGAALPSAAMAAAGQTQLELRVRAILDTSADRRAVSRKLAAVAVLAVSAIALPLIAQEPKVYKVGEDGTTPPRIKSKVEPAYTEAARDAKISGKVVLGLEIHEDGKAHHVTVKEPLDAGLDANAIRAVEAWVFEPARKNGEPVRVAATIEVNFRLQ